ncbi:MAG: prepilin-type N-terminal cleavage/methylation domain-containing protein, partial [Myxococcota bacterium]
MKHRSRQRRGMTLLEVMVVVTILLLLMTVLSIGVLRAYSSSTVDGERLRAARQVEAEGLARPPEPPAPAGPAQPVVEAAEIEVVLDGTPVADGPFVHTLLDVAFTGRFTLAQTDPDAAGVRVALALPPGSTGVRVSVDRPDGTFAPDARFSAGGVEWVEPLLAGESRVVELSYRATRADTVSWAIAGTGQPRPVDLRATLAFPPELEAVIPSTGLPPTRTAPGLLQWELEGLVAPAPIEVEVPASRTPLGRIAGVCWLAAAGLLAFCAGFWYLVEDCRPGWLDDFRLGGLLLLGLNYGVFYAVSAVLGGRYGTGALPLALAVALPLLTIHVARLIGPWFAVTRALPLAAATFGVTVAVVYLDDWRPQVLLGAAVTATAALTVTWPGWSARRSQRLANLGYAEARRKHLAPLAAAATELGRAVQDWSDRAAVARRTLEDLPFAGAERAEVIRAVDRLERALGSARALLRLGEWDCAPGEVSEWEANLERRQPDLRRTRELLDRLGPALATAVEGLERGAAKGLEELASALGEMERAVDGLSLAEAEVQGPAGAPAHLVEEVTTLLAQAALLHEEARALAERAAGSHDPRPLAVQARQLARRAEGLVRGLRQATERLQEAATRADDPVDEPDAAVHCPQCGGTHASGSRFCSTCGTRRPVEVPCGSC